jgi:hypothetical protein
VIVGVGLVEVGIVGVGIIGVRLVGVKLVEMKLVEVRLHKTGEVGVENNLLETIFNHSSMLQFSNKQFNFSFMFRLHKLISFSFPRSPTVLKLI